MRIAVCVAFVALVAACQTKSNPEKANDTSAKAQPAAQPKADEAPADPAAEGSGATGYAGDIDRICNAEELSGATEMEEGARPMHVAQWLGSNIKTEDGRQFLASLARAKASDKAKLLRSESSKVGLGGCALAKAWSGGGESTL